MSPACYNDELGQGVYPDPNITLTCMGCQQAFAETEGIMFAVKGEFQGDFYCSHACIAKTYAEPEMAEAFDAMDAHFITAAYSKGAIVIIESEEEEA